MPTPRDQGLLAEAQALQQAALVSNFTDLKARADDLVARVTKAATDPFYGFELYVPGFAGGLSGDVDKLAADYQARSGVDALAQQIAPLPPTGTAAGDAYAAASGQPLAAADVGLTAMGGKLGDQFLKYARWLGVGLVLLVFLFVALEAARVAKVARG